MKGTPPRNRFVLRRESGHPGYRNTIVLGTAADLNNLAAVIQQEVGAGRRVDRHVSEEGNPASLGSIGFQAITEAELSDLQTRTPWKSVARWFYATLFIAVCCLAVYGGVSLFQHFMSEAR